MKIINLNLECGVRYEAILQFLAKYAPDTDIFCFQEVANDLQHPRFVIQNARKTLFADMQAALPDFNGHYAAAVETDVGGLAVFIRKGYEMRKSDNIVLFPDVFDSFEAEGYFSMGRNVQVLECTQNNTPFTILNFHGMWVRKNKGDTPMRIEQAQKIRRIFDESAGSWILCTDLNVTPDTQTIAILNQGNVNLNEHYRTDTTRSADDPGRGQVVDYIIVSPNVRVTDFQILPDEASDHLALALECDIG
jgi:endonuclease/exonuclease/phosphatase family metal-dependent hydrolase